MKLIYIVYRVGKENGTFFGAVNAFENEMEAARYAALLDKNEDLTGTRHIYRECCLSSIKELAINLSP